MTVTTTVTPKTGWTMRTLRMDLSGCPWCHSAPRHEVHKPSHLRLRHRLACSFDGCWVQPVTPAFPNPIEAATAWENRT